MVIQPQRSLFVPNEAKTRPFWRSRFILSKNCRYYILSYPLPNALRIGDFAHCDERPDVHRTSRYKHVRILLPILHFFPTKEDRNAICGHTGPDAYEKNSQKSVLLGLQNYFTVYIIIFVKKINNPYAQIPAREAMQRLAACRPIDNRTQLIGGAT